MDAGNLVTTILSVAAAASSAYLWLLEKWRQSPRLRADWGERGAGWFESYQPEDARKMRHRFQVEFFAANLSALPDVLLDLRFRVRSRDGWLPAQWHGPVDATSDLTCLPVNLPPRSIAPVYVLLEVETDRDATTAFAEYMSVPTAQIEVEMIGLGGHRHRCVAVQPAPAAG